MAGVQKRAPKAVICGVHTIFVWDVVKGCGVQGSPLRLKVHNVILVRKYTVMCLRLHWLMLTFIKVGAMNTIFYAVILYALLICIQITVAVNHHERAVFNYQVYNETSA